MHTFLTALILQSSRTFAIESPTRRSLFGYVGGGVVGLTLPQGATAVPTPPAPVTLGLDVITRARAQHAREEYKLGGIVRRYSAKDARKWRLGDRSRRLSDQLGSYDVDVVRDWSRGAPEGKSMAGVVERWAELVESGSSSNLEERDGLAARILAQMQSDPWASLDWYEVFGTRLAMTELDVHARTGQDLFEVQTLMKYILNNLGDRSTEVGHLPIYRALLRDTDDNEFYRLNSIEALVSSIETYAPALARRLADAHLERNGGLAWRHQIRQEAGRELNMTMAKDGPYPAPTRLLDARLWEEKVLLHDVRHYHFGDLFDPKQDIDHRVNHINAALEDNLERQRMALVRLERMAESPVRTALLQDVREVIRKTEFERATLPQRMLARRLLAALFDLAAENPTFERQYRALLDNLPPADSREWATWQPPLDVLDLARPGSASAANDELGRILEAGLHSATWATSWIKNLLTRTIPLSPEVLALVVETTPTADRDTPPLLEKALVEPLCDETLLSTAPDEVTVTDGAES